MDKTIQLSTGESLSISLEGRIKGKKLEGWVYANGPSGEENLGKFELENNAAFPVIAPPVSKPEFSSGVKEFVGTTALPGEKTSISANLKYEISPRSADEEFLDGLIPARALELSLELGQVKFAFPQSKADVLRGTITGVSEFGPRLASLECRFKEVKNSADALDCTLTYAAKEKGSIKMLLLPKAKKPTDGK